MKIEPYLSGDEAWCWDCDECDVSSYGDTTKAKAQASADWHAKHNCIECAHEWKLQSSFGHTWQVCVRCGQQKGNGDYGY